MTVSSIKKKYEEFWSRSNLTVDDYYLFGQMLISDQKIFSKSDEADQIFFLNTVYYYLASKSTDDASEECRIINFIKYLEQNKSLLIKNLDLVKNKCLERADSDMIEFIKKLI